MIVHLMREIIRLRFSGKAYKRGMGVIMMDVMRQRSEVVEKFGIHRPALMLFPNPLPYYFIFQFFYGVFQPEEIFPGTVFKHNKALSFIVSRQGTIISGNG